MHVFFLQYGMLCDIANQKRKSSAKGRSKKTNAASALLAVLIMTAELSQVCFSLFAAADFTQRWKSLRHQGLKGLWL